MAGKITDYPTMTTLASGDLLDVSDYDGVSAFVSKSIDWDILKTNIESQITFTNLYTANGTLSGFREVEMGINDMVFKTTGDANLLRFDSTSDRIGIGLAAPAEKLDVLGNVKIATSGANDPLKVYSFNNVTLGLQQDNNANVIHNQYSHFKNTLTLGNTLSGVVNLLLLDSDWKYEHGSITIENQGVGFNEPTIKIANSPNTLNFYNTLGAGNTYNAGTGNGGYWSTGNFGIGTDPTEKLEVAGNTITEKLAINTTVGAQLNVKGTTTANSISVANRSVHIVNSANTEVLEVFNGGLVHFGRSMTTAQINLNNTSGGATIASTSQGNLHTTLSMQLFNSDSKEVLKVADDGGTVFGNDGVTSGIASVGIRGAGGVIFSSVPAAPLHVRGSKSGYGALIEDGNVGIGTSTPSQKLDVAGNINVSNAYYIATHQFLHSTVDGTASVTRGNVLIGRGTPTGLTSGGSNGQNNIFIGQLAGAASVGSFNNVAIGNGAMDVAVNTREAVAIGAGALGVLVPSTQTSSINTVALGSGAFNALIDGNYNTALGGSSGQNVTGGGGNTFIGALTGADVSGSYNHSIAIGRAAKVTASNQMVVGAQASGAHINEIFFGAGVEQDAISPLDFEMSLTNIAAGNTDVSAGYDWVHNGSRGTGTGAGGEFIWKTAPAGTTGSAQNALVEALRIKETGVLNMANIPTSSAGLSAGDIWNNSGVLSIV